MDEDLTLHETAVVESVEGDGNVLIHLIRPCVGRGRGRHLYEADMLERNAHKFKGWKMYVDHRSPEAQRAAHGLPRSVRDLGGRITESWWDPNVPAEGRFGKGAVVGRCIPTKLIRDLVENDPEIVETSINSMATGVKPVTRDGKAALLVEGISDRGSVDWVTEAGAGGKVVALMEAAAEEGEGALLAALTDDELRAYVEETRPGLAVAVTEAAKGKDDEDEDDGDDGDDDLAAEVARLMKKGLPRPVAMKAAKAKLAKAVKEAEEDENMEITPEVLAEALHSPSGTALLNSLVESAVESRVQEAVDQRVEEVIAEERELIRAEARADSDRQVELRDMRDEAHRRIREAALPEALTNTITAQFALIEGVPTPGLDVTDEYADGARVRTAGQVLTEAVDAAIQGGRDLMGQIHPTRITGVPGSGTPEGDGTGDADKMKVKAPITSALMEAAGLDPDEVYAAHSA